MATKFFEKALHYDPDYTDAHIRLGMVCRESNRLQEAVKAFEKAIFLDRQAVVARFQLAQVCIELGDTRRALTQLHLVKEIHGDYPPVFLLQGEIQFDLGDYRQAVLELEKSLELGLDSAHVYDLLGQAYDRLSNKDKALGAYQLCLEREPRPSVQFRVAELFEQNRRYAQAQELYRNLFGEPAFAEQAKNAVERVESLLQDMAAQLAGEELDAGVTASPDTKSPD